VAKGRSGTDSDNEIRRNKELALDPVRHLIEMRNRIRKKKAETEEGACMEETTFWMRENGRKLKYPGIRQASQNTMRAAGINDTAYHLKHVVMTELNMAGVGTEAMAEYGRHKQGSTVWATHYVDWKNSKGSLDVLLNVKRSGVGTLYTYTHTHIYIYILLGKIKLRKLERGTKVVPV
jgi:hypothetical protein